MRATSTQYPQASKQATGADPFFDKGGGSGGYGGLGHASENFEI